MRLTKKKILTKISAMFMAAAVITTTAMAGFTPAQNLVGGKKNAEVTAEASSSNVLSSKDRGVIYANSRTDFRDETIYFLITTRFYDGDSSNNARTSEDTKAKNPDTDPSWRGDFKGLIEKLDYIKALGFTAIWITPVVQNNSGYDYHGYHASNFNAVDYRYESNGITYQTLIDAVHAKGMKVIQDVVFNHTCNFGEQGLNKLGGSSLMAAVSSDDYPTRNQVVMNGKNDPNNIYHHNGFCGGGDWDNYEAQRKTIADDCFDLETENPLVYNYLTDAYKKYIDMGVDGFRVDTVKHISRLTLNKAILPELQGEAEKVGTDSFYMFGEVCTKGHDVWYRDAPPISTCFYTWNTDQSYKWTEDLATNEALVEQHYKDHMDTSSQPTSNNAFLNGNDYHATDYSNKSDLGVIDFQMHWSFMNANSAFNTAKSEDKYFNDSTWNVVYVDSHDYAPDECQNQRYTGSTDDWAENLSLMFTFRGIPCLYYGSEVEFQKGKTIDPGPNAPLSETGRAYFGDCLEGNVTSSDFTEFGNVSGTVADTLNSTLSQHIMRLNRLRQAIPALRKGQYSTDGCSGSMSFKRRYTDSNTDSFALVTISGNSTFSGIPNGTYVDAITGDTKTVSNGTLTANCSGRANMRVYVLNTSKTPAPGRVIPNGKYLSDGGADEPIQPINIDIVEPTSIKLDKTSVSVLEQETASVKATVAPSNATYPSVKWTTSDKNVATVSGGVIKGVSEGTATITATTTNGLTAKVAVTVKHNSNIIKPTGITLDKSSIEIKERTNDTLTATLSPSNTTYRNVTWSSSDTSVATVSDGVVSGLKPGTATITATTEVGGYTAKCNVTVTQNTDAIVYYMINSKDFTTPYVYTWNGSTNTSSMTWPGVELKLVDASKKLYAYEKPVNSTDDMIIFNSGTGDQTGNMAMPTDGKNCYDYATGTWSTYTNDVKVTSVTLNKTSASVEKGKTVALTASVAPSNAINKAVSWSTSNSSVATVSSTGVVTAVSKGTAVITATAKDGSGKSATCNITVTEPVIPNEELVNTSNVSQHAIVGQKVVLKGSATGGDGNYKFAYYYRRNSDKTWKVAGTEWGTSQFATFKPGYADVYEICIKVQDGSGTIIKKYLSLAANKADNSLECYGSVSKTMFTFGNTITIKGSAKNNSGAVKYKYEFRKASSWTFETIKDYSTATSVSWKAPQKGSFTIRITADDGTNKAIRTINIKVK